MRRDDGGCVCFVDPDCDLRLCSKKMRHLPLNRQDGRVGLNPTLFISSFLFITFSSQNLMSFCLCRIDEMRVVVSCGRSQFLFFVHRLLFYTIGLLSDCRTSVRASTEELTMR